MALATMLPPSVGSVATQRTAERRNAPVVVTAQVEVRKPASSLKASAPQAPVMTRGDTGSSRRPEIVAIQARRTSIRDETTIQIGPEGWHRYGVIEFKCDGERGITAGAVCPVLMDLPLPD
jgi:hypothetical protein